MPRQFTLGTIRKLGCALAASAPTLIGTTTAVAASILETTADLSIRTNVMHRTVHALLPHATLRTRGFRLVL